MVILVVTDNASERHTVVNIALLRWRFPTILQSHDGKQITNAETYVIGNRVNLSFLQSPKDKLSMRKK